MTEIAWAASHTKDTYCAAFYRRLAAHRGKKRALVALAHMLLQVCWHLLSRRRSYVDLGYDYFEKPHQEHLKRSLVRRLERPGHKVTLQPAA